MDPAKPKIQFREGEAAVAALSDPEYGRQWDSLHAACPWATAFQSRGFAGIWYSTYAPLFDPLLLYTCDGQGVLSGLFALAVNRRTGELVPAGAHQAEYHAWIAFPDGGDSFVESALDFLAARFPHASLHLQYLPPSAPTEWLRPGRPWGARTRVEPVRRPLIKLGPGTAAEQSLQKKRYRSRLDRLEREGPVAFDVLHGRSGIEPLFDRVADMYDLRVGAFYRDAPFRQDPFKREFYLRMADSPGLLHVSVLRVGDRILAAHLGARDRTSVVLGVTAHSPFYAAHSPGTLLLLFLGREIGREGYLDLDLTPGDDDYKTRLSDHGDSAYLVTTYFRDWLVMRHDAREWLAKCAKRFLSLLGVEPANAKQRFQALLPVLRRAATIGLPWKLLRWAAREIRSDVELRYYRMAPEDAPRCNLDPRFRRDSLSDLLQYVPASPGDLSQPEFWLQALQRLERGAHAYTVSEGGRLLHYAWVSPAGGPQPTDVGDTIDLPPNSLALWDDYTHPAARGKGLHKASIRHRLRDSAGAPGVAGIFMCVLADNGPSRHNIEQSGFTLFSTVVRRIRFGKRTWIWNHQP
jgi:CelD/BcsL family acetyltransferase involved in cellulose biosynthesis/GNAT superfamily N-acetyltransferase